MAEITFTDDLDFDIDALFADDLTFDLALDVLPPEAPAVDTVSPSSESSVESPTSSWVNELEQFLLEEDGEVGDGREKGLGLTEGFFADVFADQDGRGMVEEKEEVEETSGVEEAVVEKKRVVDEEEKSVEEEEESIGKKRISSCAILRQLRNRDSAMKSRERKKIYVHNLEMKSKFLEAECKRLEHLLRRCTAENIALQHRLLKDRASGVSHAKQESAVLSEESLLLGSLFWLVITVFLFLAPNLLAWSLPVEAMPKARGQGVGQNLETVGVKRSGNERLGLGLECESISMRRRYRALKPKMKIFLTCF